jgi:branched-chain amino acid transport system permease protein
MMNFINFAHGEFVMLGVYAALLTVMWFGSGPAVFGFVAAFALFLLGLIVFLGLIRHMARGPMLSQILSTFGLALLLRYTAFLLFSANFVSLGFPAHSTPSGFPSCGLIAAAFAVAMHPFPTRSRRGSQLLAAARIARPPCWSAFAPTACKPWPGGRRLAAPASWAP